MLSAECKRHPQSSCSIDCTNFLQILLGPTFDIAAYSQHAHTLKIKQEAWEQWNKKKEHENMRKNIKVHENIRTKRKIFKKKSDKNKNE